jgi:antitoxin component of MazEF toxin-antitoxin module
LDFGGRELIPLTTKLARIEGDALVVPIPDWMTMFLNISEGSDVIVDIVDGKLNIRSASWKPGDPAPELPGPPQ